MADDLSRYRFPQTLQEQSRFLGLPLDEAIPSLPLMLLGLWAGHALYGLAGTLMVWLLIRTAKRGKGSMWLYNLLYWYFPGMLYRGLFRCIPDSHLRHWIR